MTRFAETYFCRDAYAMMFSVTGNAELRLDFPPYLPVFRFIESIDGVIVFLSIMAFQTDLIAYWIPVEGNAVFSVANQKLHIGLNLLPDFCIRFNMTFFTG